MSLVFSCIRSPYNSLRMSGVIMVIMLLVTYPCYSWFSVWRWASKWWTEYKYTWSWNPLVRLSCISRTIKNRNLGETSYVTLTRALRAFSLVLISFSLKPFTTMWLINLRKYRVNWPTGKCLIILAIETATKDLIVFLSFLVSIKCLCRRGKTFYYSFYWISSTLPMSSSIGSGSLSIWSSTSSWSESNSAS